MGCVSRGSSGPFQLLTFLPGSLASCLPDSLMHTHALCRKCAGQSCGPVSWTLLRLQAAAKAALSYREVPLALSVPTACVSWARASHPLPMPVVTWVGGALHSTTVIIFDRASDL